MQDELPLLIQLQVHDTAVDECAEKIAALEKKIKDTTFKLDSLKLGSKTAKENLVALQLKKKQLEAEADNQEKLVKKHQSELNSLKTNDAYKSMLSEIEHAKAAQSKIEDDVLVIMEQLDQAEKQVKDVESKLKSDESVIKSNIQKLESEKSAELAQKEKKSADRNAFAETIPAPVKKQYEALRKSRGGVAIVAVVNSACTGCQMKLTQSKMIEIKKAKNVVLCESCSRILFQPVEQQPTPETPAATPPVTTA